MEKGKLLEELEIIFSSIPMVIHVSLNELEVDEIMRSPLYKFIGSIHHPSLKTKNLVNLALHKVNKSVPYMPKLNTILYPIGKIRDFIQWLRRAR